jgi:hypothetical protein
MNKIVRIICILLISSMSAIAQDEGMATEEGAPNPGGDVPVDGGISLLLAAGTFYGGRKLLQKEPKED